MRRGAVVLIVSQLACTSDDSEPPPIVNEAGCEPGSRPAEDGSCFAAGVATCAEGFESDGDHGCRALLPDAPCPHGTMAIPGDGSCRAVAPCERGRYPLVPAGETAVHVDGSYAGQDSDGSSERPYGTIGAAVLAAPAGAIIAVAAGSYQENVIVDDKAVRIQGTCPEEVEIVGTSSGGAIAVTNASGTEVRGVALRGSGTWPALAVSGAVDVLVEQVWIHDWNTVAIFVADDLGPTFVTVRDTLVEATLDLGVAMRGAELVLERSVVRDITAGGVSNAAGRGVEVASADSLTGIPAKATIRASVIERATNVGIYTGSSELIVEGTVVRDIVPYGSNGRCISLESETSRTTAKIVGVLVERCAGAGIYMSSAEAVVEDTVVRDVHPVPPEAAGGIHLQGNLETGERSSLVARTSLVDGVTGVGILGIGSDVVVESVRVRRGQVLEAGRLGVGISVQIPFEALPTIVPGSLVMRWSAIEENRSVGVSTIGSSGVVEASAIGGTVPDGTNRFGDGLLVQGAGTDLVMEIDDSLMIGNARVGIGNLGGAVSMQNVQLECNTIHLDGERIDDWLYVYTDRGDNRCGCGDQATACQVLSSGLEPPSLSY